MLYASPSYPSMCSMLHAPHTAHSTAALHTHTHVPTTHADGPEVGSAETSGGQGRVARQGGEWGESEAEGTVLSSGRDWGGAAAAPSEERPHSRPRVGAPAPHMGVSRSINLGLGSVRMPECRKLAGWRVMGPR